ncbi:MAG: DCC1-like thiol-disulfide oxidoreductase family protein [Kaistella sp.]|nr:DCC1-like thiol-disulfide oxidoreductase family protein [Kaistella sp.]
MKDIPKYYIFFDGDCGFCNYWVQWILEKDKKDEFLFSSLQSEFGQNFLKERGLEQKQFNTLYLWRPDSYYLVKSEAVLKIAKILGGTYGFLAKLNIFPRFFSDQIYDVVARNRKQISAGACRLPTEKERRKFIEDCS